MSPARRPLFLDRAAAGLRLAVAASVLFSGFPAPLRAAVPEVFEYQGRLSDASGAPRTGTFTMLFRIFDQGGTLRVSYAPSANVSVSGGVFSVLIGDTGSGVVTPGADPDVARALAMTLPTENRFLEIVVNGTALTPRQRLVSAPYAVNVRDGSVSDATVAAGAGIAYSKLNLSGLIVNGDLAGGLYPSITGVGAVASGTWNADPIDVLHGGTGGTSAATARAGLGAAAGATTLTAGTGLTGGGDLSADRTLALNLDATPGCGNASTGKLWWNGTRMVCGADAGGGGIVTGTGSTNALARWSGSNIVSVSAVTDDGTSVAMAEPMSVTGSVTVTGDISATGSLSGNSMTLGTPLAVGKGGTGAATLTGILLGNGAGAVTGAGILSNGQLLIGDGSGVPTAAVLTGTANRVTVTNGAGTISLGTPQALGTTATPTFAGLTLGTALTVPNGGTGDGTLASHGVLVGNGAAAVGATATGAAGDLLLSGGAAADPVWGHVLNAHLAGGAYGAITGVGVIASGTWNGTAVDGAHGGTGQSAVSAGDILVGAAGNAWNRLPAGAANNGRVLTVSGGTPAWSSATVLVSGSGTAGTVPRWNGASSVTDSILTDNGVTATVGGALAANSLSLSTTPLGLGSGGTGLSGFTAGDYLRVNAAATGFDQRTPAQVRGDVGAAVAGANGDITSLSGLALPTGTPLASTRGGTGQGAVATGDILIGGGTNVWSRLAIGAAGQVLTASGVPVWQTPGTPVSGSGAAGEAAFWNGASTMAGDANFLWDNTNKRLGVGPGAPASALEVTSAGDIPYLLLNNLGSGNQRTRVQMTSTQAGDQGWEVGRDAPGFGGSDAPTNSDDFYFRDNNTGVLSAVFKDDGSVQIGANNVNSPALLWVNGGSEILSTGNGAGFKFRRQYLAIADSGTPVPASDDLVWYAYPEGGSHKAALWAAKLTQFGSSTVQDNNNPNAIMEFESVSGNMAIGGAPTGARLTVYSGPSPGDFTAQAVPGGQAAIINGDVDINGNLTVNGTGGKTFIIPHPLHPDKYLIHAVTEGPEAAVYYRGTARLEAGRAEVVLPSYFEALTRTEGRTVLVTPSFDDPSEAMSALVAGPVKDGKVWIKAADGRNPRQKFDWEVSAIRKDVDPLVVEPEKGAVDVAGQGPYTYIKGWKR